MYVWYWIDTGWGCGGIRTLGGHVVKGGAPIFRQLYGESVAKLQKIYKLKKLPPLRSSSEEFSWIVSSS